MNRYGIMNSIIDSMNKYNPSWGLDKKGMMVPTPYDKYKLYGYDSSHPLELRSKHMDMIYRGPSWGPD